VIQARRRTYGLTVYHRPRSLQKINDTHGHATGDDALRHIAEQFKQAVRGGNLLARIGGEEFAVLLLGTDESTNSALADLGLPFVYV
jgi:diguanylate cyclase (GGDEF)-like protein